MLVGVEGVCGSCGRAFYKKATKTDDTCGSFGCEGGYSFLTSKPPRRQLVTPLRAADAFVAFFAGRGYKRAPAVPLTGHGARHIFTGTAGQIFDRAIFRGRAYDTMPYCVVQPVVRMQTSSHDGFVRSFVNISLERLGASVADHLRSFEDYLDFLSHLGTYAGDLRIRVYEDRPDWGTGPFRSAVIGVHHDGLEIGVLNYFTGIPQDGRATLTMSDISFGLERVAWSLNRSHRFIDTVGPATELLRATPHDLLDAYRTIVLMMQNGVMPERRTQAGSKLRSIFLSSLCPVTPIRLDLVEYYYHWWANFAEPLVPYASVLGRWRSQLARQLEAQLGVGNLGSRSPEELIEQLATNGIIRSLDLRGRI